MRSSRLHAILAGLIVTLSIQACRDAPASYDPADPPTPEAVRRLTFDSRDDRAPTWTIDGERIVYVRGDLLSTLSDLPTVLAIPETGGTAERAFPDLQSEDGFGGRPFTAPAIDPRSDRVAFQLRVRLAPDVGCGASFWLCESSGHPIPPTAEAIPDSLLDPPPPHPVLDLLALKVRAPGDVGTLEASPGIEFQVPGRSEDPSAVNPPLFGSIVGRVIVDYFPAHRLFAQDGTLFFRPSWSPVSDEVVFSDGLGLWTWYVGDGSATPIPGTVDAISPAWSPDGKWIAFVRLERSQATTDICGNFSLLDDGAYLPHCVQETMDSGLGRTVVEVIRPDGTGGQVIGEGLDPAWSPDGEYLYMRRDNAIRRLGIEDDSDSPVPDTEGGREPAVSPDGSQLAFSRTADGPVHDIWVVPALP